jgi:Domain of unknown function (DUF222)/HNH endonuclease
MSNLQSALEEILTEDEAVLDDDGLEEAFAELDWAADVIHAKRLRVLAQIERRGTYARDGRLSITSWLAGRFRKTWSAASRLVRAARALEQMPATRDALEEGEITSSAVDLLTSVREVDPQAFTHAEDYLVEAATTLSIPDLGRVVGTWRRAAEDARGPEFSERAYERRRLHVSPTLAGMVRVDGDLDPETGQTVISALRAVCDAKVRCKTDLRSFPQRRADALGEICRQWLDSADRPLVGGERPHVSITVDLATLEGRMPSPGSGAELEDAGPISSEAARRMACDASVSRVITRGSSEPLDVGRRTQVVPAGIRRAVVVRDRGCRFPGCDRPQGWSDAHHVVHWAHGGDTALSNLVLLCRRHHRLVHHGFGLEMANGRPRFFRPDGTVLEDGSAMEERGPP